MRVWTLAGIAACCAAGALLVADSAEAATKKKRVEYLSSQSPVFYYSRRPPRSRVTVLRPRSYLDAGTEVMPGERKYNEYAIPYGYSAIGSTTLGVNYGWDRRPLNDPWDAPGRGF